MQFLPTDLPEVLRIVPDVHGDDRGYFLETWQSRLFEDNGVVADFVQDNLSLSRKNTLRGIHYQVKQAQGKLVRVVVGEVFDVAVDLRRSSPSFGRWFGAVLSEDNKEMLWVPPGFGHAFLVLSDTAIFEYKCSDYYAPQHERSVRWDDPDIGIAWPIDENDQPLLSAKDAAAPLLAIAEVYP